MSERPVVDVGVAAGDCRFDADDATLLRAVDEHGSLNAATDALGRSFAHAQRRIETLEAAFGPLVDRTRGGAGGGGSELTPAARELLARLERLRAEGRGVAAVERAALPGTVAEREGGLGTIETAAGDVRALVPEDDDAVTVTVRADAVTLHRPGTPPDAGDTSARNRFRGTVVDVDRSGPGVVVAVDVGAEAPLRARITEDSLGRLGLSSGDGVVATFKATATRALPR